MDETGDHDARLQKLLDKRGQDLVHGLIEEFAALNSEIGVLKRELAALSDYQAARDRLLVIEATATKIVRLPRIVAIEADQNLRSQDGFYPLEHTSDGIPFRWTGPAPHFALDIFIDRVDMIQVKLEALSCIDFDVQKNISLLVDGESVPTRVEQLGTGLEVMAILPSREGSESTNLVFVLPAALMPPGSDDTRPLGVAFWRFRAAVLGADGWGMESITDVVPPADPVEGIDEFGLGTIAAAG